MTAGVWGTVSSFGLGPVDRPPRHRRWHPDCFVHRCREITDGAVVLVGGESACHVDSIEQPLTGRDLASVVVVTCPFASTQKAGPSCRRRWSSTSDCRIGTPRLPSTSSSVMPSSSYGSSISSVAGSAWSARDRLRSAPRVGWSTANRFDIECSFHTRLKVYIPDKPRRVASAFQGTRLDSLQSRHSPE